MQPRYDRKQRNNIFQNPRTVTSSTHIIVYSSTAAPGRSEGRMGAREKKSKIHNSGKKEKSYDVVTSSRYLAVMALMKQAKKKNCSASTVLESDKQFSYLKDRRDRAFAKLLVTTVERRKGQIELVLNDCIKKHRKNKFALLVRAALQVGVAQLLFLETPQHAALKETVEVLRTYGLHTDNDISEQLIKFANGVLRHVSRNVEEYRNAYKPTENLAQWFREKLIADWGEEKTGKIAEQYMKTPHYLDLSFKVAVDAIAEDNFLSEHNITFDILPHGTVRIQDFNGLVSDIPQYDDGDWWVQSASAATPAISLISALGALGKDPGDFRVVDMCAAPGGKTAQLLSAGYEVTAIEANARRCRRLNENLERLKFRHCKVETTFGQDWMPTKNPVHGVLLDAPCSATGTGIRRPDILQKEESDIPELLKTQQALCEHCIDNVLKKGGVLVYATCSILREESEDCAHRMLARSEGVSVRTLPFEKGEIAGFDGAIDENGWLRVLPGCLDGALKDCDGFFVARFIVDS